MELDYYWFVGWVIDKHNPNGRPYLMQQRTMERAKEQLELIQGKVIHIEEVKLP